MIMPTPAPVASTTGPSAVDRVDPWKEDGNIVLAAEGKYFRVHRSVLSAHSEIFKDMFECCIDSNELVEMCPVIHLHDTASDLEIMLKALYDRSYPQSYYEKTPFAVVAAFLHLGDKYGVSALVKEAKAKLTCAFNPTLSSTGFIAKYSILFPAITNGDPHNFQIMNLLQEMHLMAPLPMAMYHCIISCPLTDIVDGYTFNHSVCSLSPANLRSFIFMKDVIVKYRMRLAKRLRTSPLCRNSKCTQNIHQLWSEDVAVSAPFFSWTYLQDQLFCEGCKESLKATRDTEMNSAWNEIPATFGFHSWEDVAKSGDFPPSKPLTFV